MNADPSTRRLVAGLSAEKLYINLDLVVWTAGPHKKILMGDRKDGAASFFLSHTPQTPTHVRSSPWDASAQLAHAVSRRGVNSSAGPKLPTSRAPFNSRGDSEVEPPPALVSIYWAGCRMLRLQALGRGIPAGSYSSEAANGACLPHRIDRVSTRPFALLRPGRLRI